MSKVAVDVHGRTWAYHRSLRRRRPQSGERARAGVEVDLTVRYEGYRVTSPPDTKTIVFGGKAKLSDQWVDERYAAYHSLMLVQEYGVWHKVLFGTDYPFTTVNASVDGIRKLNDMLEGTKLPRLNAEQIEAMIYRDSLSILGLK